MKKRRIDLLTMAHLGGKQLSIFCLGLFITLISCQESTKHVGNSSTNSDSIILVDAGSMGRAGLANAIQQISYCKPRVIAINLLFEGRTDGKSDSALARAIGNAGNIILAMDTKNSKLDISDSVFVRMTAGQGVRYFGGDEKVVSMHQMFSTINDQLIWSLPVTIAGAFNPNIAVKAMNNVKGNVFYKLFFDSHRGKAFYHAEVDAINCRDLTGKIILIGVLSGNEDLYETSAGTKMYSTELLAIAIENILEGRFEEVKD